MRVSKKELANRLLYLPIDLNEKVLLWLTYRGLKPVSDIYMSRRGNALSLLRRGIKPVSTYNYDSSQSKRIRKWIKDAGLVFALENKGDSSWHVGKNINEVKKSAEILHQFDYESEYLNGILFGYPEMSSRAYAQNRVAKTEDQIPMVGAGGLVYEEPYLKGKYYTPYIFYNMPKSSVLTDSLTAKRWADTIRKDVPTLAKWFELHELDRQRKEIRRINKKPA